MSKKRKRNKRRKTGGWPKKSRRKSQSAAKRKAELPASMENSLGNVKALHDVMLKLESGHWDVDDLMERFEHLTELLRTRPELVGLRPPPSLVERTWADFQQRHGGDLDALPRHERIALLTSFAAPRLFDEAFVDDLRQCLMDALLAAEENADAEALALGLLGVAENRFEDNPVWECMISALLRDGMELNEALDDAVREALPEEAVDILRDPDALREAFADPEKKERLLKAMKKRPIVARLGHRRMDDMFADLSDAIHTGRVQSRLTEAELESLQDAVDGICMEVKEEIGDGELDKATERRLGGQIADLFFDFADDPANQHAFERFGEELSREAEQAAANGEERAGRLPEFASCWRTFGEFDPVLRADVVRGSINRLATDKEAEEDAS